MLGGYAPRHDLSEILSEPNSLVNCFDGEGDIAPQCRVYVIVSLTATAVGLFSTDRVYVVVVVGLPDCQALSYPFTTTITIGGPKMADSNNTLATTPDLFLNMLKGGLAALSGADILKLLTPEQRAEIIGDITVAEIPNVLPMAEIPIALAHYGAEAQWDMVKTLWHGLDLTYTNEVLVAEFGMMVVEVPEADSNVQPQNDLIDPADLMYQISESETDTDSYISEMIKYVDRNDITGDLDYTIEALEAFCDGQMFTRDRTYDWDEIEDFVDTDEINHRDNFMDNLCSDDVCEWIRNNT